MHKLLKEYIEIKNKSLHGRYLTHSCLEGNLKVISTAFEVSILGKSVLGKPISLVKTGNGKKKILAWSQMHGNESTSTKAIFDIFNAFLKWSNTTEISKILEACTIYWIPMLNPDGAQQYTRENANGVDLNRDAAKLEEEESKLLRRVFDQFQPDFCFNLHDQRTIFSAGTQKHPATLSFLTPAEDKERKITPSRIKSMQLISAIVYELRKELPQQIGRYDDSYNENCTGDAYQKLGVPTLLFEAGHSPGDYSREETRKYVFLALLSGLKAIATNNFEKFDTTHYFNIPENEKLFRDIILRNTKVNTDILDISIQFKEKIIDGGFQLIPVIDKIEKSLKLFGHKEIDCEEKEFKLPNNHEITENVIVDKIFLNSKVLKVKSENLSN